MLIVTQCVAKEFDFTALDSSYVTCTTGSYYNPYSKIGVVEDRHTVITEAGYDTIVPQLSLLPPGGDRSVRLGNAKAGAEAESISYEILVDEQNPVFVLNYAAIMQNPDHFMTRQPRFTLDITDERGISLDVLCGAFDFVASSYLGWADGDPMWKDWTAIGMDLSDYIGSRIRIRLTTRDCAEKGHYGYAYFAFHFEPCNIASSQCGNAATNTYEAPTGFNYRWWALEDSKNILSYERTLEVPMDNREYVCEMSQIGKKKCSFNIYFRAEPRYPVSAFESRIARNCADTLYLKNTSFVSNDGFNPKPVHEPVDSAVWDLGDGRIIPATDSILPVVYNTDGHYTITLHTYLQGGTCGDSLSKTFDIVGREKHISINKSICEGEYYDFNGRYLTESGIYTDTIHQWGCTEIYTLDLDVCKGYHFSEHVFICKGDTYHFRGELLTKPGIYTDTLISSQGCDSIYEVILNLTPVYLIETYDTICDVESYYFRGKKLHEPGIYYDRLQAIDGCDSVYKLHLHVLPTSRNDTTYATICVGDSYFFGYRNLTESGIYYDTVSVDTANCAIRTLQLEVVHPTTIINAQVFELCADEEQYFVHYTYKGPEPISYSIYYDDKAKSQGFVDVIDRPYDGYIYDNLPRTREGFTYVRPDNYNIQIEFKNDICTDSTYIYTMPLLIRYPAWMLQQKWNDVVAILNERTNGGFTFSNYEWYRNGKPVYGAEKSYIYLPHDMQLGDKIEAYLTREGDDYAIPTCAITIEDRSDISTTDKPVLFSVTYDRRMRISAHQPGRYTVYNLSGQLLDSGTYHQGETILPPYQTNNTLLLFRFESADGTITTHRMIY